MRPSKSSTLDQFGKRMVELLPQMIRGFAQRESNYLSRGKITLPQLWVLEYLSRQGDAAMNEIARFLRISRPAVTSLVDRLISQNLVGRAGDPADRRVVRVHLTLKGKRVLADIWDEKRRMLMEVFGKIPPPRPHPISAYARAGSRHLGRKAVNSARRLAGILLALALTTRSDAADESPNTLTLPGCYALALKRSEEIALRAELIAEAEARFLQSLSGVLPKLSFSFTDKRQDGSGASAFTRRSLPERKFTFSQPLFSGFKEFAAMKGSKLERRQREHEKARAEQLLLVDVSDAFHLFLEQRENIRILNSIRQTLLDRNQELEAREKIGRSRLSELTAVQAQLYRVEAEWEAAQARERIASHLLQFLTGLDAIGDLADPDPTLPSLEGRETYLARAATRADVKAAEQALEISHQELRVARSKFFPTVGAEGNYYVERSGAAKDVKWDASLEMNVPIFQGGSALGATREAESGVRQAELQLRRVRRVAGREILDAYADYEGALAQVRALTKALEASEENYQLQVEEYRRSLVSNLEVLSVLQNLQDARGELVQARSEALRRYWKLKVAAGETA